jgi:hypothetical protein
LDVELVSKIARCEIDPETHKSYEEILSGKRKLEQPTKVVFKKNTANKKGLAAGQESNTRLTKYFGVK